LLYWEALFAIGLGYSCDDVGNCSDSTGLRHLFEIVLIIILILYSFSGFILFRSQNPQIKYDIRIIAKSFGIYFISLLSGGAVVYLISYLLIVF
jgi:hypothetical protein